MNMEGPGMSLFQGAPSIHINNSAQDRLEEQEEIEDQKRRDEELQRKLDNGFDDLLDDDEASSVNSSGNFTLDAGHSKDAHNQLKTGCPPTYVESMNHVNEAHALEAQRNYCETPVNHYQSPYSRQEEILKLQYSPFGAGDGQNHYSPQDIRGHLNGINNFEARQEYMNNEKLKVLYEMRIKECQEQATRIDKMESEIDSLRARLAAAVNDRDKVEFSLRETSNLFASSKHKMTELEQQVTILTQKLISSEQGKEQLQLELAAANVGLQDAQTRLRTFQVSRSHDTDALFREQQDRHREEVDRLQSDLTKAKNRLYEKDNEIKQLEKKCLEKESEKEEILIEKGSTINRLAKELEAAQSRLLSGETAKLKEKVAQLTNERNILKEQVKELGSKLEVTANELGLCRNKLEAHQKELDNWKTTLHQILLESLPGTAYTIGEPPSPGKLATLKEVLNRHKQQLQKLQEEIVKRDKKLEQNRKVESELRSKIEEQKGVETQLTSRIAVLQNKLELLGSNSDSELLENYKQQNVQLKTELEDVKAELKNLDLKYTELELDYDKLKSEKGSRASKIQEANADLQREFQLYSDQLKETLKENGELKTLYFQACCSRDAASRELKDIQSKIKKERESFKSQEKEYIERIEKDKQQLEKLTTELTNSREDLEAANKRISELQREFTDKQKEFTDRLNRYLEDEKSALRKEERREPCAQCEKHLKHIRQLDEQISKCSIKLATQESNEELMKELKSKAEFFQQYILERVKKLQEQRQVGINTEEQCLYEKSEEKIVSECEDAFATKTAMMMKEKAIRDQIAEKFTLEIKTIEMNCARRIKEVENENIASITKLKELLERKAKEIDTLKEFILAERSKVTKIIESKENEISLLIKEHNELQEECQKAKDDVVEYRLRAEKYKERAARLHAIEDVLKKEREEWVQKNNASAKDWQAIRTKMAEMQAKVTTVEQRYEKLQVEYQTLQDKYRNAKKTVFTYKDYMAKKDSHINNEMARIQEEYRKIFIKLQNQLNHFVKSRVEEERKSGKTNQGENHQQEYNYKERMEKLNEEFAKLAQSQFNNAPE